MVDPASRQRGAQRFGDVLLTHHLGEGRRGHVEHVLVGPDVARPHERRTQVGDDPSLQAHLPSAPSVPAMYLNVLAGKAGLKKDKKKGILGVAINKLTPYDNVPEDSMVEQEINKSMVSQLNLQDIIKQRGTRHS